MSRAELSLAYAEKTLDWAQRELELSAEEVAQIVGANRRTVMRWRGGHSAPSPEHRRQLERLNQLRFLLRETFRSPDSAQRWMHEPAPGLRGRTPHFALTEGDADEVLKLLASLASGAFR